MTRSSPATDPGATDELAPLRAALVDLARSEAERTLAAAEVEVSGVLARAEDEAEQITAAARDEAADDAARLLARQQARRDREARGVELRARRAVYDELVRRAHLSADALAHEALVHDQLLHLARAALGPEADLHDDGNGGVVAELGGRRAEYSLRALADEAVADLLAEQAGEP